MLNLLFADEGLRDLLGEVSGGKSGGSFQRIVLAGKCPQDSAQREVPGGKYPEAAAACGAFELQIWDIQISELTFWPILTIFCIFLDIYGVSLRPSEPRSCLYPE